MIKRISFNDLKSQHFFIEKLECHRQMWSNDSAWLGNAETPRPLYGLCFFCSDIEARYLCDGKEIIAHRGDVIYIPKGCFYKASFKSGEKEVNCYTVNFEIYDRDGSEICLSDKLELIPEASSTLCIDIAAELADAFLFSKSELQKQSLFLRLVDAFLSSVAGDAKIYRTIRDGVALLRKEWNQNEKMKKYADACGISESGFYALFKQWSGNSPVDYRNNIRMNAAKSMLENTNMQISEISFSVGFDDQYYFSRIFKKLTGVSPRAFRNR